MCVCLYRCVYASCRDHTHSQMGMVSSSMAVELGPASLRATTENVDSSHSDTASAKVKLVRAVVSVRLNVAPTTVTV